MQDLFQQIQGNPPPLNFKPGVSRKLVFHHSVPSL